jgi:hypothetical protein
MRDLQSLCGRFIDEWVLKKISKTHSVMVRKAYQPNNRQAALDAEILQEQLLAHIGLQLLLVDVFVHPAVEGVDHVWLERCSFSGML